MVRGNPEELYACVCVCVCVERWCTTRVFKVSGYTFVFGRLGGPRATREADQKSITVGNPTYMKDSLSHTHSLSVFFSLYSIHSFNNYIYAFHPLYVCVYMFIFFLFPFPFPFPRERERERDNKTTKASN